jgi:hypothetical protein
LRESQALMTREAVRRKAVSELLLALQQTETLPQFAQAVLHQLSRFLALGQAFFATVDPVHGVTAQAHYAGTGATPAETLAAFAGTAGLLERCVATGETLLVSEPGDDYLRIRSGLGSGAAAAILLLPVKQPGGAVVAMVELAVTQAFTPDQRQLLDELAPIVCVSLERFQRVAPATGSAYLNSAPSETLAGIKP